MMDYEHEQRALVYAIGGGGLIRDELRQLNDTELAKLGDALEDLAQIVDEQATLRWKRRQ